MENHTLLQQYVLKDLLERIDQRINYRSHSFSQVSALLSGPHSIPNITIIRVVEAPHIL